MRISKRAAIRTNHPNFVYCLETVTVRDVFELLYLGGLWPYSGIDIYIHLYAVAFVKCSPGQKRQNNPRQTMIH